MEDTTMLNETVSVDQLQQHQEILQLSSLTELNQKFASIDMVSTVLMHQFPGICIPKLTKSKMAILKKQVTPLNLFSEEQNMQNLQTKSAKLNPLLSEQFEIFRTYLHKICTFEHLVKNPTLKLFLEKKSDLRSIMTFVLK